MSDNCYYSIKNAYYNNLYHYLILQKNKFIKKYEKSLYCGEN